MGNYINRKIVTPDDEDFIDYYTNKLSLIQGCWSEPQYRISVTTPIMMSSEYFVTLLQRKGVEMICFKGGYSGIALEEDHIKVMNYNDTKCVAYTDNLNKYLDIFEERYDLTVIINESVFRIFNMSYSTITAPIIKKYDSTGKFDKNYPYVLFDKFYLIIIENNELVIVAISWIIENPHPDFGILNVMKSSRWELSNFKHFIKEYDVNSAHNKEEIIAEIEHQLFKKYVKEMVKRARCQYLV